MRNTFFLRIFVPFAFIYLLIYSCTTSQDSGKRDSVYASLNDSTRYVGKEACKECHADKYESYMNTGMGMSFDSATEKKSAARFSVHDVIHDSEKDLSYYPHWRDGKMVLTEFRLKGKDTIFKRDEVVSYIVGSGQHTNSHMINVNGYVYQAPATYYTQKGTWDLPPGFEHGFNSRFSRKIELECMSCHNAYPKLAEGSTNKYDFIPRGIDCERCHGPASRHIEEMKAGHVIDAQKEIDYTIVNPAKLPVQLQLDICQRCHIQGNAILGEGKSWYDFKPGMKLESVMNVFMPVYKGAEDEHIMASHAERMKRSKCYLQSIVLAENYNKTHPTLKPYQHAMTCVTCHNPHISVRSTDKSVFDAACRNCHQSEGGATLPNPAVSVKSCSISINERNKTGNNCVACHMPKNGTIDIPHVTTTDHWIRKPVTMTEKEKIRQFVGLACINNPNVDRRTKGQAYLSYYEKFVSDPAFLDSAKTYFDDSNPAAIESSFRQLIRWSFLKKDYDILLRYVAVHHSPIQALNHKSITNDDAWTAYRIGEAFHEKGGLGNAIQYMKLASELAPYELDFRNKLAGWQMDAGIYEEAEKNYRFILKENPRYISAYVSLGFLLLSVKQDVENSKAMYDEALALDPDHIQAMINMAGLELYLGNNSEAIVYLNRVLKLEPKNQIVLNLMKKLHK